MCGITGIVTPQLLGAKRALKAAIERLGHRGPDDHGVFVTRVGGGGQPAVVGLGHARLSILDLSPLGHQPMVGPDGAVIVHNGEIFNYVELRDELRALGHVFETDTDTEVVLAAYRQWGPGCVARFVGMWAFALWDGRRLVLCRDRLGQKPLYYYADPEAGVLVFASEIKALRAFDDVPWHPDEGTVHAYLARAEMEGEGRTFFEGIRELPPGSQLVLTPGERLDPHPRFYWLPERGRLDVGETEAVERTRELLFDSVRLRLRSDAPLGFSLSGGLDSTLLLATANALGCDQPDVFSTGYREQGYDETEYIAVATRELSCRPHAAPADVAGFREDFPRLVRHLDQPSRLPGPFSQWRVAQLATGRVKVLIDGQGADELAGGYQYLLPTAWREQGLLRTVGALPDMAATVWANRHVFRQYPASVVFARLTGLGGARSGSPVRADWHAEREQTERPGAASRGESLDEALYQAVTRRSLPPLLRYGDRVNMAFGIENRCPFLDHRLVEWVLRLPPEMKIRGGTTKWVFREVARPLVPREILERRVKMGFPTPFGAWLRGELTEMARGLISQSAEHPTFARWVDTDRALALLDEHASGRVDHHAVLWRLMSVATWLRALELPD